MAAMPHPRGPKPEGVTAGRAGLYAFLAVSAAFFLLPAYVMVVTSLKTMDEIRLGRIFALPAHFDLSAWVTAWSGACTGLTCNGIGAGFWNSVKITVLSVAISVIVGAINGYALSFWRPAGAKLVFGLLMLGAFLPFQIFIYPLVRGFAAIGIADSLAGVVLVHVLFGLPLVTLLFRNYYAAIPVELFKAARVDGAGFWRIFLEVILPMSTPMIVVASIFQTTGIWNDFLFGLIFAGRDNLPMTVQLNNIVNTTTGERFYNVNMAATLLAALVPLVIYFVSGRWFVRGIAAGAVKG
ncbi:sugar ABC transporter permease [Kaistia algarum]|uniref:carbohydrate ABC transporter permease n=1 Tax=Kaistia algarum TaxID=2083279 RepID=UPI000CE71D4B|nr:carbohydrate ABC transporter permease [Kaistia algarum]MCX5513045.1 carbohydrate ABC transporter permease [Kaistia algarum]PPE81474.1 sugar ABC transporter permease [Kaistia algarum]